MIGLGQSGMNKSVGEIKKELEQAGTCERKKLLEIYAPDTRAGVQKLLQKYRRQEEKLFAERQRLKEMQEFERQYAHCTYICGVDEAGRGPLAGPVAAGAVILPKECEILYLNDSKKLSPKRREVLYDEIMEKAVAVGIGMAEASRIDAVNILQATYEAMRTAVRKLGVVPDVLLNDAVTIPRLEMLQVPIVKGDARSISIAAASILAKVTRDRLMVEYDKLYPQYGFAVHKGYGTAAHIEALKKYGPCPIHRNTFIANFV